MFSLCMWGERNSGVLFLRQKFVVTVVVVVVSLLRTCLETKEHLAVVQLSIGGE